MNVTKRDGTKTPIDLNRLHQVCSWSCEALTGVSVSELELKSSLQFYDGIKTSTIMEANIKAAADLISEDTPNYQYVAGRLVNYHLRKQVYKSFTPPSLYDHVKRIVDVGYYDKKILEDFTKDEIAVLDTYINHDRDFSIVYVGMEQYRGKYLVKNRNTGEVYETPQMANILIAACLFADYPKETRMKWIRNYYDAISNFDISLPTPVMAGVRTPQRQYSSCVLIESDDSIDSINATASAVVRYSSQRAGLGIGAGRIRAVGSPVRNGDTTHTGVVPFYKYFQAAVKSCAQGGIRMSSATLNTVLWHYEIEDILVLKNNKGVEDNRARHLDYVIQINKLFYERLINNQSITLFSPNDVPEMYEAFFVDYDKFKALYEKAERSTKLRKKTISAVELFSKLMTERKETGRIYIMNVDNMNDHSSFDKTKAPIRMTNLCVEIGLSTKPFKSLEDPDGEISLCVLSAINFGRIKEPVDFERPCALAVRGLDQIISSQSYPLPMAERSMLNRRSVGVGIINFAYWLAKNDISYDGVDKEGLEKIHEYLEAWSYYLIKASVELAKEKGPCGYYADTKYSLGLLPIDTYKKEVDELVKPKYKMDWKKLRADIKEYGIRNSTLMAIMPAESSAALSNATNGIEPPRAFVSSKQSKDGVLKQVVPEYRKLKNKYNLLWDQKSPVGYLKICAVLQKFIDQAISVNTSYNPKFFKEEKIPMSVLLQDLLFHYKYGGKTLYYFNTADGAGELPLTNEINKADTPLPAPEDNDSEGECSACKI